MKCREIIEKLNQLAPEHIACCWQAAETRR